MEVLQQLFDFVSGDLGFITGVISTFGALYFGRDRWQRYLLRADEYADALDQVTDQLKANVDVKVDDSGGGKKDQ